MSWLHRLQQRLSITKNEALTLLSLSLFLLLGTAGRHICRQIPPVSAEDYAEIDSVFAARSAAIFKSDEVADGSILPSGSPSAASESDAFGTDLEPSSAAAAPPERNAAAAAPHDPKAATSDAAPKAETSAAASNPAMSAAAPKAAPASVRIDLNTATMQELDKLPRVGPKTAERIIAFREAYGSFRSVDDLLSVSGIGPKTLELIRPHAYVSRDSEK